MCVIDRPATGYICVSCKRERDGCGTKSEARVEAGTRHGMPIYLYETKAHAGAALSEVLCARKCPNTANAANASACYLLGRYFEFPLKSSHGTSKLYFCPSLPDLDWTPSTGTTPSSTAFSSPPYFFFFFHDRL